MSRRDHLRALFSGRDGQPDPDGEQQRPDAARAEGQAAPAAPEGPALERKGAPGPAGPAQALADAARPLERAGSGALRAMGVELSGLAAGRREADELRKALIDAAQVIELDTARIAPAFVRDRMDRPAADDAELEASIAAHGQQVPVLLRPHPHEEGRFETVYGHRRIAALRRLGRPVRAVVRQLDDDALVVAQGQENNERRDLSFIERARFAAALQGRGFDRATIIAALGVHSADITRYSAVTDVLPGALMEAIGPAPRIGRPRWLALAERLQARSPGEPRRLDAGLAALIAGEGFAALGSEERFAAAMRHLEGPEASAAPAQPRGGRPPPALFAAAGGRLTVARQSEGKAQLLALTGAEAEAFAGFMAARLPALYAEFSQIQPTGDTTPRAGG